MTDVIPTWVYDVLSEYHNCSLPNIMVETYGVDYLTDLLSDIMGKPIEITSSDYMYEYDIGQKVTRRKKKVYTAWMKN